MPTTIAGIKVNRINIEKTDDGTLKAQGGYSLISNKGIVLATQDFNGYEKIKVDVPQSAMQQMFKEVEKALSQTIGLEED